MVFVIPNQFRVFRIHANHRLSRLGRPSFLPLNIAELAVPIRGGPVPKGVSRWLSWRIPCLLTSDAPSWPKSISVASPRIATSNAHIYVGRPDPLRRVPRPAFSGSARSWSLFFDARPIRARTTDPVGRAVLQIIILFVPASPNRLGIQAGQQRHLRVPTPVNPTR